MTAEEFQSAYEDWRDQLRKDGKPPLSIAHFGAAICTQQEDHLDKLRDLVYKAAGVTRALEAHC